MRTLKSFLVIARKWDNPGRIPINADYVSSGGSVGTVFACFPTTLNAEVEQKRLTKDYGRFISVVRFVRI